MSLYRNCAGLDSRDKSVYHAHLYSMCMIEGRHEHQIAKLAIVLVLQYSAVLLHNAPFGCTTACRPFVASLVT